MRIAVDIWDILYREGLISWAERNRRLDALAQSLQSTRPTDEDESPSASDPTKQESKRTLGSPTWWNRTPQSRPGYETEPRRLSTSSASGGPQVTACETAITSKKRYKSRHSIIAKVLAVVLYPQIKFVLFWFSRLPDRRELEHRHIAACQYIGPNLDILLPSGGSADDDVAEDHDNSFFGPNTWRKVPDRERRLQAFIKSSYLTLCHPAHISTAPNAGDEPPETAATGPPPPDTTGSISGAFANASEMLRRRGFLPKSGTQ